MKAYLAVNMDNAVFKDDLGAELSGIFQKLAEKVKYTSHDDVISPLRCTVQDTTGNTVGNFAIVP